MTFQVVRTITPAMFGVPAVPCYRMTCRVVECHWAGTTSGREFLTLEAASAQAEYHVKDTGHTVDIERLDATPSTVGQAPSAAAARHPQGVSGPTS